MSVLAGIDEKIREYEATKGGGRDEASGGGKALPLTSNAILYNAELVLKARGWGVRDHVDDGWGTASIPPRCKNPIAAAQDVLFITAVHAHSLSPSTPNTSSTLMDDGASDNRWDYLTKQPPDSARLSERPHAQSILGGGNEIGTPSFVDAVECADDNQVEFRIALPGWGAGCICWEMVGRRVS
ncbi:uncharacterized protein ARMOST_06387 [Armillaria ostoyae]|uniref:Uncharacterized protein n=1 Tax=Armillaria ostoyae TaxID=47428 RepID=A0A284R2X1_ARMOS|nr:uncharacterized protein ARMOST_06387 [Armillaria ostoyae]